MNKALIIAACILLITVILDVCVNYAVAGVALGSTRVIYPEEKKQVQLTVSNNDDAGVYLIQAWVENANGKKETQFVITPPLFSMQGKKENTLRIIDATNGLLPKDRESLFWLNVKAIPSMDKKRLSENTLQLAIVSRIKLIYRPQHLLLPPESAPEKVTFRRNGGLLVMTNPTPYYLTVTDIFSGTHKLDNTLLPPLGKSSIAIPQGSDKNITFRVINDYGALSPKIKSTIQ